MLRMDSSSLSDINKVFAEYLYHSYLYYKVNMPLITDSEYDALCKRLLDGWESVTHVFKHLVTIDDLEAGTGYAIQYPKGMEKTFLQHSIKSVKWITEDSPL